VGVPVFWNPCNGEAESNHLTGVIAYSPEEGKRMIIEHMARVYRTGTKGCWTVHPIQIGSGASLEQTVEILSQLVNFPEDNLRAHNISIGD
jgi:hypothetical protein